ncbi:four-carbon acid sugar kinase family protein [Halomonas huangheensis]|uniref:Hrp-dependent type III effector protein n=1 Tax=Halomonas huangheensis TaxID=1178482 RepID=W1N828_9GAMM|nr:four-carbon acid sugar kinase family protein [Halomonas huangheensis]ALM53610.1 Hrp-dependent type III effector protein [Halomonas huangheensis]ERL51688.1 hypothetical protein BJB45_11025 [Halomonas huangheensis]
MSSLLLTYYGDDLTGSTDALEALECHGVSTVLFTRLPSEAQLQRFADCRAIGLAGTSRSESPQWMRRELQPALQWLAARGAPLTHYKTCSTFDSSPRIGSIGCAMEVGREVFHQAPIPLVVGVPQLRRYTIFGELHAAWQDQIYRIDRHPVMSCHPVTPMREADLRRHLAEQTSMAIGLIDAPTLLAKGVDAKELDTKELDAKVDQALNEYPAVLFDVLDERHQAEVGRQLWRTRCAEGRLVVGSSGVEYALTREWQRCEEITTAARFAEAGEVDRIAVVSGSVSATTARQIEAAQRYGFEIIAIDAIGLADANHHAAAFQQAIEQGDKALASGRSVILHTASGPQSHQSALANEEARHILGRSLGDILRQLTARHQLSRVCVSGGDTSSHAISALDIHALTLKAPFPAAPGAPLCTAHSDIAEHDGLEVVFKGGQMGGDDFFERLRRGGTLTDSP